MAEYHSKTFHLKSMEMPFTLKFILTSTKTPSDLLINTAQKIQEYLNHVDQQFSPFVSTSLVSKYQNHQLELNEFTSEFQEVYGISVKAQEITDGAFNPFYNHQYDPTGVVKGWAIQRGFEISLRPLLQNQQVAAVALNGAGDIQMGVAHDSNYEWQIGIEDPLQINHLIYQFTIKNGAVATSGFSKRGSHIQLQDATSSIIQSSIVADELIEADIMATAVISMGQNKLKNFKYPLRGIIIDQQDHITELERR